MHAKRLLLLLALVAIPALAQVIPDTPAVAPRVRDPRTVSLIREDCVSTLARQEVTLFANGTVRLRQGPPDSIQMALHELPPAALAGFVRRLEELEFADAQGSTVGPGGEWTDRCTLELDRGPEDFRHYEYERNSTGDLSLERARRIVEDLLDEVKQSLASSEIPSSYRPVIGDRLERTDGELFEIVSFTLEGKGVELVGVEQPITIFVERDRLREMFRRIAPRS